MFSLHKSEIVMVLIYKHTRSVVIEPDALSLSVFIMLFGMPFFLLATTGFGVAGTNIAG
jgi:hypothetical protein